MERYDQLLHSARDAFFEHKQYADATSHYQAFFDTTYQENSYAGPRLSYCLAEWNDLAQVYSPAMDALLALADKLKRVVESSHTRRDFHEYASVAQVLGKHDEVFSVFEQAVEHVPELGQRLFAFVYPYCAEQANWALCYRYLGDGVSQYEKELDTFDAIYRYRDRLPLDARDEILTVAVSQFTTQCTWLLRMLKVCGTASEYKGLRRRIQQDFAARELANLTVD